MHSPYCMQKHPNPYDQARCWCWRGSPDMFKIIVWGSMGYTISLTPAVQLCNKAISDDPARTFSAASDSKHTQMKQPQIVHQHPSFHFFTLNQLQTLFLFRWWLQGPGSRRSMCKDLGTRPWNKLSNLQPNPQDFQIPDCIDCIDSIDCTDSIDCIDSIGCIDCIDCMFGSQVVVRRWLINW